MNLIRFPVLLTLLLAGLMACSQEEPANETADETSMMQSAGQAAEDMAEEAEVMTEEAADMMHGSVEEETAASVFIISPEDGAVVTSPVTVKFGIEGMQVAPAGTMEPNTGHHHLLVDLEELPPLDQPIPADENHIHFGKGQTEVELELTPGEHSLQLLLGDGSHVPHDPPLVSETITITVEE